jgi:hypothetical protein
VRIREEVLIAVVIDPAVAERGCEDDARDGGQRQRGDQIDGDAGERRPAEA